jgi:hypothetical protein
MGGCAAGPARQIRNGLSPGWSLRTSTAISSLAAWCGLTRKPGCSRTIRHRCDEASCHRPSDWVTGSAADNAADYATRKRVPGSPLTDRRGAAGRARAIRDAILAALARGDTQADIETVIWRASAAGIPGGQARLF